MKKAEKIATHDFPVWREKADFIIASRLGEELGIDDLLEWEQLWARKVESNSFELCCIPFFAYGLALGDVVETKPFESRNYVVNEVISHSGRRTFRVFFQSLIRWNEIIDEITSLGCTVEVRWEHSNLIAVDVASVTDCDLLKAYLAKLEKQNEITWENGN
jgi:hypothetical protein